MEVFKSELQLVGIQPFGAPTKLAALQLLNDEPEAFDLRLRLSEVGAFGRKRPDHPLQRLDIVWQIGKIDVHDAEVYPDSRASSPIHMPVSQSAAVIIPPRPVATAAQERASRRGPRRDPAAARPGPASRAHRYPCAVDTRCYRCRSIKGNTNRVRHLDSPP